MNQSTHPTVSFCQLSVHIDEPLLSEYDRKLKFISEMEYELLSKELSNPTLLEIAGFEKLRKAAVSINDNLPSILNEFLHVVVAYNAVLNITHPDLHRALIEAIKPCNDIDEFIQGCLSMLDTERLESLAMIYSW